jgi:16S rRNA (guanine527-N7)-methyltransferase
MNLTAIREPEAIVTRHFGESLFAAWNLFPEQIPDIRVADVGSGAGFPGIPLKLWSHGIHLTLIESNHKKATFLKEVSRALTLMNVDIFAKRAEDFPAASMDVVSMRAVESFERVLPAGLRLLALSGRLALLVGQSQVDQIRKLAPNLYWQNPLLVPGSSMRILMVGSLRESNM